MPVSLRDWHAPASIEAGRAQQSVAELEAELAERRAEAERSRVEAERQARQAERSRVEAERAGKAQLAALSKDLADALASPDPERPPVSLRGAARSFLYGAPTEEVLYGDPVDPSMQLEAIAARDPVLGLLSGLHRQAGGILIHLATDAGLGEEHDLFGRADDLECACWRALLARVRVLAGEVA